MLRNTAKMFSQMLYTDAMPWSVLSSIRISEETTSSSSRVFIKLLFQDLAESMGLPKLAERLFDDTLTMFFTGLFPKDDPQDTRFAINFWTSVGLGGLTDDLREHLRFVKIQQAKDKKNKGEGESSDDSSGSDSSSSDSSDSDDGQTAFKRQRNQSGEEPGFRRDQNEKQAFFKDDMRGAIGEIKSWKDTEWF